MKKLQNNFTTPEQSKRLLELGVPADSADCYLLRTRTKGDTFIVEVLHDELYSRKDKFEKILEYLPCWSVGRLMEIAWICSGKLLFLKLIKEMFFNVFNYNKPFTESVIDILFINNYVLDFSKLEE